MKLKKILSLALILVLATALFGCGKTDEAAAGDLLKTIQDRGTIIVAMEGTWAPWTYHDEQDNLVGYDVEVAKAIGEKLSVDVEFVEGEWDGLLAGLSAGRYDIMVNGVDIDPERQIGRAHV